jgi:predicted nucleic-acid-binding protein
MRAIDTNILVRLIARDDADQLRAAEDATAKGAWVSHLVLAETVWVLSSVYDLTRAQIVTAVEMLLNHRSLAIQDADTVTGALGHFRARRGVEFSDCLIVEIARKAGHSPLMTFDRDLAKIEGVERLR